MKPLEAWAGIEPAFTDLQYGQETFPTVPQGV